ncbi:MAG: methyltransferase domain-containing protein [Proteobacteria bacterium]|nr:methyltransferase domain-containing protein [Pseudomonadota bacterium]
MSLWEASAPWRERWIEGRTAWDQGQEHPAMTDLLQHAQREAGLKPGSQIFSAGCGRAHNEAWLARQGYQVEAIDVVPEAIAAARLLYADVPKLRLAVQDVFSLETPNLAFDAVFDRAMLCALQPEHRLAYLEKLSACLRPGGLFMSILFRAVKGPSGPPFAVNEFDAMHLLSPYFDLCFASPAPPLSEPQNVLEEWLCIWSKRGPIGGDGDL